MQLDGELRETSSKVQVFSDRSYKGMLRGIVKIAQQEGLSGLCKG